MIGRTPCRDIRLPQVRLVDRPYLNAKQLTRLASALGPDQAPMMWLGAVLGLRWAEAAGLTVSGFDRKRNEVTVEHQLGRDGELVPPKSAASRRTKACPKWLADDLAALINRRRRSDTGPNALLFVTGDNRPLDYTNWRRRVWLPAREKAGLPDLLFHDLRSMAATALVAAGVDVKTAQTRLGHSSPQVTLGLYARATAEGDRKAARAGGEIFRPRDRRAMKIKDEAGTETRNTV